MDVFDNIGSNYDYYPNTAIGLCVISYSDIGSIAAEVASQTNLTVVWGPAQLVSDFDVTYSLMYAASNAETGECFVVIRGTTFDSAESWLKEDFDIAIPRPFSALPNLSSNVPTDACISQGTFNGMSDLISLTDPSTGQYLVDFLADLKPSHLYVTGHSLGGTLTPTMFAYLNDRLYGGQAVADMNLWSFAGLTPGGAGFNTYFNSLLHAPDFQWRIQNSLDIAPFCWWSFGDIEQAYIPNGLHWDFAEKDWAEDLFNDALKSGIGYSQPQPGLVMTGTFDHDFPARDIWIEQVLSQHHSTTYQAMVKAQFPSGGS